MKWLCVTLAGFLAAGIAVSVSAQVAAPVLKNPDFEKPSIMDGAEPGKAPDDWFYFSSTKESTSGITDRKKRSGSQAVLFKAQKEEGAFHGIAQKFPAQAWKRYEFSVCAASDPSDPLVGDTSGQVSLEWQDYSGKEIGREAGASWNVNLSAIRWEKFKVSATAPKDTSYVIVVVTFFSCDSDGYGTCYIDDANLAVRRASD